MHSRVPAVAEVLGYIGGALALSAVAALVIAFWEQIGVYGRVGIAALLAVAGLVGGVSMARVEDPAGKRLSQFLMFVGVAGVGATVGFAVQHYVVNVLSPPMRVALAAEKAGEWAWFAAAAAIAVSGGIVWWFHRTWLQHLAFGAGVAASSLLVLPLLPVDGPDWGAGAVLAFVSAVWGALALLDRIPPRVLGLGLATAGVLGGIELMAIPGDMQLTWPLWIGAAAGIALIVAGSAMKEYVVLGIAAFGLTVFSAQIIGEYLGFGIGTSFALVAIGFALLGYSIWLMRRPAEKPAQRASVIAEVAGYVGVALAVGGAGVLLNEYWDELGVVGRVVLPLVGSVVGYGSALLLERAKTGSARRLSQVLFGIGAITAAVTAAMVARPIIDGMQPAGNVDPAFSEKWTALVGGIAGMVSGGVTWWLRKGSITQIVFIGAILMTVITGMGILMPEGEQMWIPALLLSAIGIAWVVLGALDRLLPSNTAIAAGSVVAIIGLQMLQRTNQGEPVMWGSWLALGLAAAAIVVSVIIRRGVLLGFGASALVMFSITTIMTVFEGRIAAPILILIIGVVLIVVAVAVALLMPRMRRGREGAAPPPAAPTAPAV